MGFWAFSASLSHVAHCEDPLLRHRAARLDAVAQAAPPEAVTMLGEAAELVRVGTDQPGSTGVMVIFGMVVSLHKAARGRLRFGWVS